MHIFLYLFIQDFIDSTIYYIYAIVDMTETSTQPFNDDGFQELYVWTFMDEWASTWTKFHSSNMGHITASKLLIILSQSSL